MTEINESVDMLAKHVVNQAKLSAENSIKEKIQRICYREVEEYDVGIIVALNIEYEAILKVFGEGYEIQPLNSILSISLHFEKITINAANGKKISIVLCKTHEMGNNAAAVATTALLYEFPSIKEIIMCGIAGGIPQLFFDNSFPAKSVEKHVRLGDVVCASKGIWQYDLITKKPNEIIHRAFNKFIRSRSKKTFDLLKREYDASKKCAWTADIRAARQHRPWKLPSKDKDKIYIKDNSGEEIECCHPKRPNRLPFLHFGIIGSANLLLRDAITRNSLSEENILAVEMEGSGVADSAWTFDVGHSIIRGVTDYCDEYKSDDWHPTAAINAAAVAKRYIQLFCST